MYELLVEKNNNVINVSSNTSTTPMPSYDPVQAHSIVNNNQNIEELSKEPINIARTQNVSTNTTRCTSRDMDSYFELTDEALKEHIASLEKQLRDKHYIIGLHYSTA